MLTLLLSLAAPAAPAGTPGFVFDNTMLYEMPSIDSAAHALSQRSDLVVTGPSQGSGSSPRMIPVRLSGGQEGFVQSGEVAKLVNADGEMHYYLTDRRRQDDHFGLLLVMTDADGELVSYTTGPVSSGERLHRITDVEWPGVDELIVLEAYRSSCPGSTTSVVMARIGEHLDTVTTVSSAGESTWHDVTEIYRPVKDADGVVRFRHLTRDTYLPDPIIRARPGVLIAAESYEEPWGDQMGRRYTMKRTSQRVIEWSIEPVE